MAVAVGPALRIEPHVSASVPGVYTSLAELVCPASSFRLVAVVTATALLGTEPAMGVIRLWDKTYNGWNQVRIYGTQTVVIHIPTVSAGDLVQVTAAPWVDDDGYWEGARVWIERAEITLVDFADVPATPSSFAPPLPPPQWSVADHASGTELTYTLGDTWGLPALSTAWRFRPLGSSDWLTLSAQDTDGLQTLPFDLVATIPGLGIQSVAASYESMQLGLSPLAAGTTIGSGGGDYNIYELTWDWDEYVGGEGHQELTLATTSDGGSSAGRFPIRLARGQVSGTYGVAGAWAVDNKTIRDPSATRYRTVGAPPNLTGSQVGWLRVSQGGSTMFVESSPDGVTYETWFTETMNLAQHTLVGPNHGVYLECYDDPGAVIVHSYKHIAIGGIVEAEWDAETALATLPTTGWPAAANGVEYVFPGGVAVAFWDGVEGVITNRPGTAWEVQGQQSTGAGASVWGPTYVWTHHGGEDAPTPDPGGGGYGFDYGNDYGGT